MKCVYEHMCLSDLSSSPVLPMHSYSCSWQQNGEAFGVGWTILGMDMSNFAHLKGSVPAITPTRLFKHPEDHYSSQSTIIYSVRVPT